MSRYIDAEWLKMVYEIKPARCNTKGGYLIPIHFILESIDKTPSIDIIRCKECRHWHKKDELTYCDRIDYGYGYKADDFCSYGEREGE